MASDLIERLRAKRVQNPLQHEYGQPVTIPDPLCTEAADRIASLEAEVAALRGERAKANLRAICCNCNQPIAAHIPDGLVSSCPPSSSDFLGMFDGPMGVVNKYRKTALIEATQWFKDGDHPAVRMSNDIAEAMATGKDVPWIDTLEGGHIVTPGDWIATGVQGEHWAIKPDVFAATYEPVALLNRGDGNG